RMPADGIELQQIVAPRRHASEHEQPDGQRERGEARARQIERTKAEVEQRETLRRTIASGRRYEGLARCAVRLERGVRWHVVERRGLHVERRRGLSRPRVLLHTRSMPASTDGRQAAWRERESFELESF